MRALGTPLIFNSLYSAAQKVPNPNKTEIQAGRKTVYDTWKATFPSQQYDRPDVSLPGSGSDFAPFRDRVGIPCVDIRYTWDKRALKLSAYPMYHSVYETFYLVDNIMDIKFNYHKAVGQVWLEMARNLADSLILPFNVTDFSNTLRDLAESLLSRFGKLMDDNGIKTGYLRQEIQNFTEAVQEFEKQLLKINRKDPLVIRRVNDQLMQIDRAFLDPFGLPGRKYKRHLIFTESNIDTYSGSSFPGLSDALTNILNEKDVPNQWEIVRKHYSVILQAIQGAAAILKDTDNFVFDY